MDPNLLRHNQAKYHVFVKILQKPNWVNAELKFTLSGDSSSSSQSSENDQLKLSEMPIPEYIKEIASRGMLKF